MYKTTSLVLVATTKRATGSEGGLSVKLGIMPSNLATNLGAKS